MCLAVPGRIVGKRIVDETVQAQVEFGGIMREVCLDFVPEAEIGDYVMVHVGFAISRVDADEAERTYELLEQMGALPEMNR
jgi:hydrogenase expression/formation protein HypC